MKKAREYFFGRGEDFANALGDGGENGEAFVRVAPYGDAPQFDKSGHEVVQRFDFPAARKLVAEFNARKAKLLSRLGFANYEVPFYNGHPDFAENGGEARDSQVYASAYDLEAREDGLYARIRRHPLLASLKNALGALQISPRWLCEVDIDGILKPFELISFGLVKKGNLPNADFINNNQDIHTKEQKEMNEEQLKQARALLSLAEYASVDEVLAAIASLANRQGVAEKANEEAQEALKEKEKELADAANQLADMQGICKRKDDEALVLTLLGCCFLISFFAYKYEFSLALGAFLVGIIGGSSDVRDRLATLVDPLKSMFSAVFFISIGLLVNPRDMMTYFPQILLVSGVVIGGKLVNNLFMSLATGTTLKTAVQNSFSLAQIGEFAFMTAILYKGMSSDSTPAFFPIAIGASLLTTLLNPLMIRLSEPVGNWLEGALSTRVLAGLSTYQAWVQKLNAEKDSEFRRRASSDLTHLCVYAALLFAVFTLVLQLYRFDYSAFSAFFERNDRLFFFIVANAFFAAFLPLIHKSARSLGGYVANVIMGKNVAERIVPMRRLIKTVVMVACFLPFLFEWEMLVLTHLPSNGVALAVVALTLVAAVVGWRFFRRTGSKAIDCFNEALTAEERRQELEKTMTITVPDGAIHRLTLTADSPAVGGTVVSMNIRAKTGASIVSVERGGVLTRNIGPEWEFAPGDTLVAIGDAHQLAALKDLLGVTA